MEQNKGGVMQELIEILSERKVTRGELSSLLGESDRTSRRYIEKLRQQGHIIINDGDGYTIPTKKVDVYDFLKTYYHQSKTMAKTLEKMMKNYNKLE
jgi:transcription initiation factor IIE alpha subunit